MELICRSMLYREAKLREYVRAIVFFCSCSYMELHIFAQNIKVIALLLGIQNQVNFSCILLLLLLLLLLLFYCHYMRCQECKH